MGQDFISQAKIGGPASFDPGLSYYDDMEGYNNWAKSGTGGDDDVSHQNLAAYRGSYGLQLKTRVTNPAQNDTVTATRQICLPTADRLVLGMRWATSDPSTFANIQWILNLTNGTRQYYASIKATPTTPKTEYITTSGAYTAITALAQANLTGQWDTFRLVIDLRDITYKSLLMRGILADISAADLYDVGSSTTYSLTLSLTITANSAAAVTMYVDDLYVGEHLRA